MRGPIVTTIRKRGQRYYDETMYATLRPDALPSKLSLAVFAAFNDGRQHPDMNIPSIHIGYRRVMLNWVR